jgi:hypothetical protein
VDTSLEIRAGAYGLRQLLVAQRVHNGKTSQQELSATVWADAPTSILPMSGTMCEPVLPRDSAEEELPSTVDSWFYRTWVAPVSQTEPGNWRNLYFENQRIIFDMSHGIKNCPKCKATMESI